MGIVVKNKRTVSARQFWEHVEAIASGALADRLFIRVYPRGTVYADRYGEENGHYKHVAFLPSNTLKLELAKDCPEILRESIIADAACKAAAQIEIDVLREELRRVQEYAQSLDT